MRASQAYATASPQRVLITGGAGAIGRVVCRCLAERGHAVRSFDRVPTPGVADSVVGDITDPTALDAACDGRHTIVHLAACPNDADFLDVLLPNNIVGLYQVMQAAVRRKVHRVVLASTMQVVMGLRPPADRALTVADGTAAPNHYAATKVLTEEFARLYAHRYKLSTVAVRIGWFARNAAEAGRIARHPGTQDIYLGAVDCGCYFVCTVESPTPAAGEWAILFATSRPANGPGVDLVTARRVIGYEPVQAWPEGTAELL